MVYLPTFMVVCLGAHVGDEQTYTLSVFGIWKMEI